MSLDWLIRGIHCENVNGFLTKSIFEEPYVSVERKKRRRKKKTARCLTDWATTYCNRPDFCESISSEQSSNSQHISHYCRLEDTHTTTMQYGKTVWAFTNCECVHVCKCLKQGQKWKETNNKKKETQTVHKETWMTKKRNKTTKENERQLQRNKSTTKRCKVATKTIKQDPKWDAKWP